MADTMVEAPLLRGLSLEARTTIDRKLQQELLADHRFRDTVKRITLTKDMLLPGTKVTGGPYSVMTILGAFPARFGRGPLVVRKLTEVLVDYHSVSVVERTRKVSLIDTALTPTSVPFFKRRQIDLQPIGYTIRSRKRPRCHATLAIPMAEGPDLTLYHMPGNIRLSPTLNRLDERWMERVSKRLARVKPETLWRRMQQEGDKCTP